MSGESRPKAAPADAQDVKDDSTATEGRKRVDVTRYPPVTVAALQRLPGSSARTFAMAFAIGQWLDMDGSTARLSSGKTAGGSLVDEKRLPDVLEQVGITARTWREYVTEWEANYIGHRCRRGKAFLFSRPLLSSCPACGTRIYVDHPEKSAHLPRGPGFANGVIDATPTASSAPLRGTNSAVQEDANGTNSAVPEHDPATPGSRGFNGREVGSPGSVPSDEAVDLSEVASREGSTEDAPPRSIDPWPSHFEDKRCPECRCWPHQGGHFAGCSRRTVRDVSA
jgi:hypothetical protein